MSQRRTFLLVFLIVPLLAAGCRVRPFWLRSAPVDLPPEAFAQAPTIDDVIYVVNANTQRVQKLQTENAVLHIEGVPALRASLAYEQPRNFRLHAQLSQFTGQELDLGSNEELFWFYIRRDQQPSVYFARHDQFVSSPARDLVPIEPNRLIDSLGLIWLDPQSQHVGPVARDSNLLEVRSRIPSPSGDLTRVLLIDAKYGWLAQQHYYDANGQLLMSARASQHRFYSSDAVTLPHHVELRLMPGQPSQMALDVDIGNYVINRLSGDAAELWTMPQIDGVPAVDITDPRFRPPVAAVPSDAYSPLAPGSGPSVYGSNGGFYQRSRTARIPAYRGYNDYSR